MSSIIFLGLELNECLRYIIKNNRMHVPTHLVQHKPFAKGCPIRYHNNLFWSHRPQLRTQYFHPKGGRGQANRWVENVQCWHDQHKQQPQPDECKDFVIQYVQGQQATKVFGLDRTGRTVDEMLAYGLFGKENWGGGRPTRQIPSEQHCNSRRIDDPESTKDNFKEIHVCNYHYQVEKFADVEVNGVDAMLELIVSFEII